jgi:hypothetical protein
MATTLSTIIRAQISAAYQDTTSSVSSSVQNIDYPKVLSWPNGVVINTADKVFAKSDTVSSGSPKTYDVSGGITDAFGNSLTLAKVTAIAVFNNSTTVGEILSIGAGSNPLLNWVIATGDGVKVGPGGFFAIADPSLAAFGVTAGTGDVLQVAVAAGTNVPFDIVIVGRTA